MAAKKGVAKSKKSAPTPVSETAKPAPTSSPEIATIEAPPPATPADALPPDGARPKLEPINLGQALADAFRTNERINQLLLDMVEPRVWRTFPMSSSRRNIATSFSHIHNVRCMRIRASDPSLAPERLDRATVSQDEVRIALGASARAMLSLIDASLAQGGRVRGYPRDVVLMTMAAVVHEAHHRGQICHWLRELGSPLSPEKQLILWEWDKRWKEIRR